MLPVSAHILASSARISFSLRLWNDESNEERHR